MFFVIRPFLQSTFRPRGGENINFDLLKLLRLYFTIFRLIDWDIEQDHTTILKIPHIFGQSHFLGSTLRPCGGEKRWFREFNGSRLILDKILWVMTLKFFFLMGHHFFLGLRNFQPGLLWQFICEHTLSQTFRLHYLRAATKLLITKLNQWWH